MELSPISSAARLASSAIKLEARCERKQGNVARLLDRKRKAALMPGANARQAARNNLAALGDEALKQANVTVRDRVDLLCAELADLLAAEELPSARTAGAATWARWARSARTCGA